MVLKLAERERTSFSNVFTQGENPEEMETFSISQIIPSGNSQTILNIINNTKKFESKGQIRRLIQQGAIKIDGQKVKNSEETISFNADEQQVVIKAGKKIFFKIIP